MWGQWRDNKKNGKGTYYFANGDKYVGDWVDDLRTGQGVFTYANGDRYERCCSAMPRPSLHASRTLSVHTMNSIQAQVWGQFKDGKKNGKGTYYYANGNKYMGDWVDENRTGQGVFTWPSGDRYERCCSAMPRPSLFASRTLPAHTMNSTEVQMSGQFKDDKKNGKATCYLANGDKYVGDWVDDLRTGQGVFTYANGDRYERCCSAMPRPSLHASRTLPAHTMNSTHAQVWGQFKDDKKNGKGTYYFASGNKYVGDWVEDNRTGQGVLTYTDGDRYERRCSAIPRPSLHASRTLPVHTMSSIQA